MIWVRSLLQSPQRPLLKLEVECLIPQVNKGTVRLIFIRTHPPKWRNCYSRPFDHSSYGLLAQGFQLSLFMLIAPITWTLCAFSTVRVAILHRCDCIVVLQAWWFSRVCSHHSHEQPSEHPVNVSKEQYCSTNAVVFFFTLQFFSRLGTMSLFGLQHFPLTPSTFVTPWPPPGPFCSISSLFFLPLQQHQHPPISPRASKGGASCPAARWWWWWWWCLGSNCTDLSMGRAMALHLPPCPYIACLSPGTG